MTENVILLLIGPPGADAVRKKEIIYIERQDPL